MDGWMDRWMDRWMDVCMNVWMDGWMNIQSVDCNVIFIYIYLRARIIALGCVSIRKSSPKNT